MTSYRADDLDGRIKEVDVVLSDNDYLNPDAKADQAPSTVLAVVDQVRWHYEHISTP